MRTIEAYSAVVGVDRRDGVRQTVVLEPTLKEIAPVSNDEYFGVNHRIEEAARFGVQIFTACIPAALGSTFSMDIVSTKKFPDRTVERVKWNVSHVVEADGSHWFGIEKFNAPYAILNENGFFLHCSQAERVSPLNFSEEALDPIRQELTDMAEAIAIGTMDHPFGGESFRVAADYLRTILDADRSFSLHNS